MHRWLHLPCLTCSSFNTLTFVSHRWTQASCAPDSYSGWLVWFYLTTCSSSLAEACSPKVQSKSAAKQPCCINHEQIVPVDILHDAVWTLYGSSLCWIVHICCLCLFWQCACKDWWLTYCKPNLPTGSNKVTWACIWICSFAVITSAAEAVGNVTLFAGTCPLILPDGSTGF